MSVKGMVVVMTFSVMACKSLGLKWTTEALHTNCCEGQDKILIWNCSLEKNETVQNILWFFNLSIEIAYVSESGKFDVHHLYKGRVERIGKMGILLKNVSSVDTGNYSLYLNLGPEPPENMQTIFLTVFESPTYQCKPSITNYSENILFCSTNSCGGIQLSTEWRISEKYDFVSNESYLEINSSWNAKLVSCCLLRQNMQCQNGNLLDFCASTIIFFAEDKHAPDSKYTENSVNLTPAVIVLATTNFLSIVVFCFCYRKKKCRSCAVRHMDEILKLVRIKECEDRPEMEGAMQDKDANIELEPNMEPEARPLMRGRSFDSRTVHFSDDGSRLSEGRSSETSRTNLFSDARSNLSEGRSSETSRTNLSDARSNLSEGRSSETSRTNLSDARSNLSEGRPTETSRTNLFSDARSNLSEGKSSESETAYARSSLSEGSSISHLNEDSATNSLQ